MSHCIKRGRVRSTEFIRGNGHGSYGSCSSRGAGAARHGSLGLVARPFPRSACSRPGPFSCCWRRPPISQPPDSKLFTHIRSTPMRHGIELSNPAEQQRRHLLEVYSNCEEVLAILTRFELCFVGGARRPSSRYWYNLCSDAQIAVSFNSMVKESGMEFFETEPVWSRVCVRVG